MTIDPSTLFRMPGSIRDAVSIGDITRSVWPVASPTHLNLFMGSGRMGACFDAWGLMNEPFRTGGPIRGNNPTVLMSADHWFRDGDGTDWWLPSARLCWADRPPAAPETYQQQLRLFDGQLHTTMRGLDYGLDVVNAFNPARPNVLAVMIHHRGKNALPPLMLRPLLEFSAARSPIAGTIETVTHEDKRWIGRLRIGSADTAVAVEVITEQGSAALTAAPDGLRIDLRGEASRHLLLITVEPWNRRTCPAEGLAETGSIESFLADCARGWQTRWGDAYVELPVSEHQALWARSMFYILGSYGADVRSPAPPMGWAGLGWWQHFPQDLSYIHPALLRFGHLDIAKSWIEFYRGRIDEMRRYTRRVFNADGAMWAWQFPIGADSQVPVEAAAGPYQYQIHNAAYPARMAMQTAKAVGDRAWSLEVAWPVIYESAKFFGSVLHRQPEGKWGIHLKPSFGQEEFGGCDAPNYLCSLFASRYTLTAALAMSASLGLLPGEAPAWREILSDGLSFSSLYDDQAGVYSTNGAVRASEIIGHQKHPIQLSPLMSLPQGRPDVATLKAFARRADLCDGFDRKQVWGWTLPTHWVAAVHLGEPEEFVRELTLAMPFGLIDPQWTQIYESTGWGMFFMTSHGLYVQAVGDAFVHDFFDELRIESAVPAEWAGASYCNLRAGDGTRHSGRVTATAPGPSIPMTDCSGAGRLR